MCRTVISTFWCAKNSITIIPHIIIWEYLSWTKGCSCCWIAVKISKNINLEKQKSRKIKSRKHLYHHSHPRHHPHSHSGPHPHLTFALLHTFLFILTLKQAFRDLKFSRFSFSRFLFFGVFTPYRKNLLFTNHLVSTLAVTL